MSSPLTANVSHIPAWRRLGLKLKAAQTTLSTESANDDAPKRKRTSPVDTPLKKLKTNSKLRKEPTTPQLAQRKSVTFTPETKIEDGDSVKQLFNLWKAEQQPQDSSFKIGNSKSAFQIPQPPLVEEQVDVSLDEKERRVKRVKKPMEENPSKAKSHKPKKIFKPQKPSSRPFLQYLRQYYESRDHWKFNKNHQNHLLKHAFNIDVVPSDHADFLIEYIKGLQGGVRTRLRDSALEYKVKDQKDGVAGFPDTMSQPEKRQREYEIAVQEYITTLAAAEAGEEVGYEEGILLNLPDKDMRSRVAKRIRTERILATLAATPDRSGSPGKVPGKPAVVAETENELGGKASTQTMARRRKQRTTVTIDSDSTSSSSDDSSDESSEESSEESAAHNDQEEESSSSSSSSSSSESGGESESEGSDESDSE
ncbi:hypothetical protein QTJ16_005424 [Diplocarpon rosae]|uniref:WKF domain-containing protein n=1 Tax=Diplocarpon rosae TaxID=946125 RepID=A0AAD9SYL5_9HELO|nr:hypothetical protein QTJ16_005424 [Diplocarpon rosae]PBP18917.1 proteasome subunit alpha type 6 [Diplocarpon rosae]